MEYPTLYLDECKKIISKMIEQTVRDYVGLEKSPEPVNQRTWLEASCFLFEEEYRVDWGGDEKSLEDFLGILNIDIDWFREKVEKKRIEKSILTAERDIMED